MNNFYSRFVAVLSYLQLFASFFTAIILTFAPSLLSYKQFVVTTSCFSFVLVIYSFLKFKEIRTNLIISFIFSIFIILLYKFTSTFYTNTSPKYESFFMVLYGQSMPAILIATIVSKNRNIQKYIKSYIPLIGLIFSGLAFISTFFPTSSTNSGYVDNDNGLNYHTASYLSACSTGLILYYYFLFSKIKWISPFNSVGVRALTPFFIIINFITILIAGGRGGLVLFITLFVYMMIFNYKLSRFSFKKIFKYLLSIILLTYVVTISADFANNLSIETSGFERILDFMHDQNDDGRNMLRELAINSFMNSPILGHGVGSVFYEIGAYSHNIFTDLLVEVGVVGTILFVLVLIYCFSKLNRIIKKDPSNVYLLIIFLSGFVMLLFSGYYLATIRFIWIITFVYYFNIRSISTKKMLC